MSLTDTSSQNEICPEGDWAQPQRRAEGLGAELPSFQEEPLVAVWASDEDSSWEHPTGRRPWGRPRIFWRDYVSHLVEERPREPKH